MLTQFCLFCEVGFGLFNKFKKYIISFKIMIIFINLNIQFKFCHKLGLKMCKNVFSITFRLRNSS